MTPSLLFSFLDLFNGWNFFSTNRYQPYVYLLLEQAQIPIFAFVDKTAGDTILGFPPICGYGKQHKRK